MNKLDLNIKSNLAKYLNNTTIKDYTSSHYWSPNNKAQYWSTGGLILKYLQLQRFYVCMWPASTNRLGAHAYSSGRCPWTALITATTAITAAAEHIHRAQSLRHCERVQQAISNARYATDPTGTLPVRLTAAIVEPVAVLPSATLFQPQR